MVSSDTNTTGNPPVIGVIGVGNMGSALVRGWLRPVPAGDNALPAGETADGARVRFVVWDKVEAAATRLLGLGPVRVATSLDDLVAEAGIMIVAVKPKDAEQVLSALARLVRSDQTVVSSMAGLSLEWMRRVLGPVPSLVRIMPNLGVELGAGAVAFAADAGTPAATAGAVMGLLRPLGLVESVPEELFDVVTAVSGSGPAFLAVAVEGLEDGLVAAGSARQAARALVRRAAATVALLAENSDPSAGSTGHPAAGDGSERAAMELREKRAVRGAFQEAVGTAVERSRQMRRC